MPCLIHELERECILRRYKNIREAGGSLVGTGSDQRTAPKPKPAKTTKKKKE